MRRTVPLLDGAGLYPPHLERLHTGIRARIPRPSFPGDRICRLGVGHGIPTPESFLRALPLPWAPMRLRSGSPIRPAVPSRGRERLPSHRSVLDMGPDVFMTMLPVLSGVWVLISTFSWWALLALVSFLVLITYGNALIRGKVACLHCKQRELGCPALRLFEKRKENE